jgi:hypothetical protein
MAFTLDQMIKAALLEGQVGAMQKIAQEAGGNTCAVEGCGRPCAQGSEYCEEHAKNMARQEAARAGENTTEPGQEKTSSARIYKLASAVEYIVNNFGNISRPMGRLKLAQEAGTGIGPNALPIVNENPVPGEESEDFGEAENQIPVNPRMEHGSYPTAAQTAMGTDEDASFPPAYPEDGVMKQSSRNIVSIKRAMLRKQAEEADGATISASTTNTLPENQSSQMARPAEVTSQEKLVGSSEAAIDYTKADSKEVPKKRMGEILTEPMQSASTDKTLDAALGSALVNQAGAKIASARNYLKKIASEGCTCKEGALKKCGYCSVASKLNKKASKTGRSNWTR